MVFALRRKQNKKTKEFSCLTPCNLHLGNLHAIQSNMKENAKYVNWPGSDQSEEKIS